MLRVLHEDNHLLVVDKPAGIATMGSLSGESMHSLAADYVRRKYNKPGKVFIGIVSRLDTMTSGVLVLARTSKAASRLVPQFGGETSKQKVDRAGKVYLALLEGDLADTPEPVTLSDFVRKDDQARRMRVVNKSLPSAQEALLQYIVLGRSLGRSADVTLVAVRLLTGRKHQIRVQFSDRGHCVLGDRKYGSQRNFGNGIGLHSLILQIDHPTLKQRMEFTSSPPNDWNSFIGGLPSIARVRETIDTQFDLPVLS
ncbi:MAG: RNA pseudouridine synthase [Pirellulaceae bacterium]